MSFGPKQSIAEGYEKFVIKNAEGCWDWSGCIPKSPAYGQFRYGMKLERAHRASWIINFGEIPKGMCVLHKCDNKRCSKPDHLFLGTRVDNNRDMIIKGYHPTLGKSREDNHNAVLTESKVSDMRRMLRTTNLSHGDIAKIFNIHKGTVSNIKCNKTWKGVS